MIITTSIFAVPLAASVFSTCAIFAYDKISQPPLSSLDRQDIAPWQTAPEWLVGAPIEHEFQPRDTPHNSPVTVATHNNGRWRTLQRYGTVQSVTRWDVTNDKPLVHAVGNEYLKVMASVYAALQNHYPQQQHDDTTTTTTTHNPPHSIDHLHLGIGGGTLPMLLNNHATGGPTSAIDLDPDVVALATQHLGFNPTGEIEVHTINALQHQEVVPPQRRPHSAVFVDIAGSDNNIPAAFVGREFVQSVHSSLKEGGVVVANFHRGNNAENARVEAGSKMYSEVFGSCVVVTVRFQGNVIIGAVKHDSTVPVLDEWGGVEELDVEKARRVAVDKGWKFDPESRLRAVRYVRGKERVMSQWA